MNIEQIGTILCDWFNTYQRALPWRKTYDPYAIWISEVMLQQTQMHRGVQYFLRWIERFPDVTSIAQAQLDEIYRYWEGLGYYSRARNVHKAANAIALHHNGVIPCDYTTLRTLPGIGDYTATAIMSIAFRQPMVVLDTNVLRVISRLYGITECTQQKTTQTRVKHYMQSLLHNHDPRILNQSVMELGEVLCLKKPTCSHCPIAQFCVAHKQHATHSIPYKSKKVKRNTFHTIAFALWYNDAVFMRKRSMEEKLWSGFWEFPEYKIDGYYSQQTLTQALEALCLEYPSIVISQEHSSLENTARYLHAIQKPFTSITYNYTTNTVVLHLVMLAITHDTLASSFSSEQEHLCIPITRLKDYTTSSAHNQIQQYCMDYNMRAPLLLSNPIQLSRKQAPSILKH